MKSCIFGEGKENWKSQPRPREPLKFIKIIKESSKRLPLVLQWFWSEMKCLCLCYHRTKVGLGEMCSRDSKLLYTRLISPFCCTALSLMWAVSSMGSAPAHISLTLQNICLLTTASQAKGWAKLNSWFHIAEIRNTHLMSRMGFELSTQAGCLL